jgi:hypothetical protein
MTSAAEIRRSLHDARKRFGKKRCPSVPDSHIHSLQRSLAMQLGSAIKPGEDAVEDGVGCGIYGVGSGA